MSIIRSHPNRQVLLSAENLGTEEVIKHVVDAMRPAKAYIPPACSRDDIKRHARAMRAHAARASGGGGRHAALPRDLTAHACTCFYQTEGIHRERYAELWRLLGPDYLTDDATSPLRLIGGRKMSWLGHAVGVRPGGSATLGARGSVGGLGDAPMSRSLSQEGDRGAPKPPLVIRVSTMVSVMAQDDLLAEAQAGETQRARPRRAVGLQRDGVHYVCWARHSSCWELRAALQVGWLVAWLSGWFPGWLFGNEPLTSTPPTTCKHHPQAIRPHSLFAFAGSLKGLLDVAPPPVTLQQVKETLRAKIAAYCIAREQQQQQQQQQQQHDDYCRVLQPSFSQPHSSGRGKRGPRSPALRLSPAKRLTAAVAYSPPPMTHDPAPPAAARLNQQGSGGSSSRVGGSFCHSHSWPLESTRMGLMAAYSQVEVGCRARKVVASLDALAGDGAAEAVDDKSGGGGDGVASPSAFSGGGTLPSISVAAEPPAPHPLPAAAPPPPAAALEPSPPAAAEPEPVPPVAAAPPSPPAAAGPEPAAAAAAVAAAPEPAAAAVEPTPAVVCLQRDPAPSDPLMARLFQASTYSLPEDELYF